jgi:hypothetical protein
MLHPNLSGYTTYSEHGLILPKQIKAARLTSNRVLTGKKKKISKRKEENKEEEEDKDRLIV